MHESLLTTLGICALIFLVAALYSSVGHGGASGYLAVMAALCVFSQGEMKSTALILNILVAGIASVTFMHAGHFAWRRTLPFLLTSVPAAFLGGMWHISDKLFGALLGLSLVFAAARLFNLFRLPGNEPRLRPIALPIALPIGAGIGVISGLLGIGGGIFLSPLLLLCRWATVKEAAATAAVFIMVNSLAGLTGHLLTQQLQLAPMLPFIFAALGGAVIGSYFGARRSSNLTLQRCLATVLLLAAGKLLIAIL